jgi:prepilin-type N-terminal cleavage/methylation domain-containing protein
MCPKNKEVKGRHSPFLRQAMSLTELVVVLFILGLGSAMVIPLAGDQGLQQVNKATYRIIADLQYVQGKAIGTRTVQALVFDVSHGEYYYPLAGNPSQYTLDPFTKKDYRVFFHTALANTIFSAQSHTDEFPGVELDSINFGGETGLYFDSLGLPTDSGGTPLSTAKITIKGNNMTRILSIDTTTGRVTIN